MRPTALRICPCGDERRVQYKAKDVGADGVIRRPCRECNAQRYLNRGIQEGRRFVFTPRDDIDDVAVDRLLGGDKVAANVAERIEATAVLTGLYRLDAATIAGRLKVTPRTVVRYRRELRESGRLAA